MSTKQIRNLLILVLISVPIFFFATSARAIQDSEDKVLFGPIGVGIGEVVRVNVYAIGNPNEQPWSFAVRFFNRRGDLVHERRFDVAPGVTASVDASIGNPDEFPAERSGRRTLRAEIVGFNPQPDPPGKYAATLEVYSQLTGHTSILLGGPDTLPATRQ
jgi:hypothetical protein